MSSTMSKPGSSDPRKAKQEVGSKSKGKVGDWFRHVSSSGKEYYYNITSHASQWEKPREWLDYEKRFGPVPYHSSSSSKPNSQHHHVQQQQHHQQQQQQHSSSTASSVVEKALAEREREREQREREFRERDRDRGDRYHHHQQQHHHHQFNNSSSSNMNSSASSSHSHHSSYAHSSHSSSSSAAYDRQRGEYPIPSTSHTSNMLSHHHQQQQQQQQQQQHHHLQQHSSQSSSSHPHQNHPAMSSSFSHSHHHHSASTSSSSSAAASSNRGVHNHSDMSQSHHGHPSSNNSSGLHSHNYGMHPHQQSRHFPDGVHLRHAVPSTSAAAALRDTRKPSEDLQAEDMDISPLDDSSSPISLDSKKIVASSSSNFRDSHQYPHASTNSSNKDTIDLTREDLKNVTSSFLMSQQQQQMAGRLNLITIPPNVGNNGYGGRDREREREQRDRDIRENRERERLGLDRDNNQRDQRDNRQIHRDVRDSPRRDRDRGRPRDRTDHRERDRDRDQHRERDRSRSKLRDERSRSPWDKDGTPERPSEVTGSGNIGSLATLAALSQQPDAETPPLPASLAQYYREDLIAHVKELPGDALERQANKIFDEIMTTTAIQISKVSTELKMARSLVRLTDIQATLQEQRILFLRQQIESLEASERDNSAMLGVDTVDP